MGNHWLKLCMGCMVLLLLTRCGRSEQWNVLIVTFDTTRADRIGCYGNTSIQTPNVDALAAEGVLFEKAFTPIPITLPSHTTIMTGKVPFAHGVRDNGIFSVGPQQKTLAEYLKEAGYATGAAIASFPLTSEFGINQGFDFFEDKITAHFEDFFGNRNVPRQRLFFDERNAGQVNEALLPWLETNANKPFFAWAHYFDPHQPHEPPAPYSHLYASDLYNGEIAYADQSFGVLVNRLKELGVYEKTLIILTADHGEGMGDHNEETHSMLVYNSTLHVPLIIKAPQSAKGRRISQRVGTVDIFPTVMEVLGFPLPNNIQGRSLKALLSSDSENPTLPDVPYYAETLSPRLAHGWGELRAFFEGDFKYIHGPRREMFQVIPDHAELEDLVEPQSEMAQKLKIRLQDYLDTHAIAGLDASLELDAETMERLVALGYVHSSGDKVGTIQEVLRDDGVPPQDRVVDNGLFSTAKNFLYKNKPVDAKEALVSLLRRNPDNPYYLELHASALRQLGLYDEALAELEKVLQLNLGIPPQDQVLLRMGQLYFSKGNFEKGLEFFQKSQAIRKTADGQYTLALYHRSRSQDDLAVPYLEETLRQKPHFAPAKLDMALIAAKKDDTEKAREYFEGALTDDPYFAKAYYNYGTFLVRLEKPARAKQMFTRAAEINPNYAQAYFALLTLALDENDAETAWQHFFKLTEADRQGELVKQAKALMSENL